MSFLKLYWLPVLVAVTTAFLTWQVAGLVHDRAITALKARQSEALDKQKADLESECRSDKQITYGVSNGLQTAWSAVDGLLSVSLRNDTGPSCIVPVAGEVSGRDEKTGRPAVVPGARGISARWLKELAAEADKLGAQLDHCQLFIDETWAAKGQ